MTDIEREMEDQLTIDMAAHLASEKIYHGAVEPRMPAQSRVTQGERTDEELRELLRESKPGGVTFLADDEMKRAFYTGTGIKNKEGKAPVWQGVFANFPNAMLQVAHVSAYGQSKHPSFQDWKIVPEGLTLYRDALGRHMLEIAANEQFDAESQLLHAAHFAWNALAVLELELLAAADVK